MGQPFVVDPSTATAAGWLAGAADPSGSFVGVCWLMVLLFISKWSTLLGRQALSAKVDGDEDVVVSGAFQM